MESSHKDTFETYIGLNLTMYRLWGKINPYCQFSYIQAPATSHHFHCNSPPQEQQNVSQHIVARGIRASPSLNPSGPVLQAVVMISVDIKENSHKLLFKLFSSFKIKFQIFTMAISILQNLPAPLLHCTSYHLLPRHSVLTMMVSLFFLMHHNDICSSGHL